MELLNQFKYKVWFKAMPYGKQLAWWIAGKAQWLLKYFSIPKTLPELPNPARAITSVDLARTYTSFGGLDIRVYADDVQIGTAQAISFLIEKDKVRGSLVCLALKEIPFEAGQFFNEIRIKAANEYGVSCTPFVFRNVTLDQLKGGISIDDIVVEVTYNFSALSVEYNAQI